MKSSSLSVVQYDLCDRSKGDTSSLFCFGLLAFFCGGEGDVLTGNQQDVLLVLTTSNLLCVCCGCFFPLGGGGGGVLFSGLGKLQRFGGNVIPGSPL